MKECAKLIQQKRKMQLPPQVEDKTKMGGHPLGTCADIWMGVIRPVLL